MSTSFESAVSCPLPVSKVAPFSVRVCESLWTRNFKSETCNWWQTNTRFEGWGSRSELACFERDTTDVWIWETRKLSFESVTHNTTSWVIVWPTYCYCTLLVKSLLLVPPLWFAQFNRLEMPIFGRNGGKSSSLFRRPCFDRAAAKREDTRIAQIWFAKRRRLSARFSTR